MSKAIVSDVLTPKMTAQIWTGNYTPVFPFTPQYFSIGAILPAVLYMFRWGHRRGRGKFNQTFADDLSKKATTHSVASRLAHNAGFTGFEGDTANAILGDLLLAYVLENKSREEGQNRQVQRIFPTHYFASWVDLPDSVINLRGIPEMIVALLVNQPRGEMVESHRHGRYPVGCRIEENELLQLFAAGTGVEGEYRTSLTSDRFDETTNVGLDQLVTIRLAQECRTAPEKARGKGEQSPIPNQRPIATQAAKTFYEDLTVFLRAYAAIPRLSLVSMLETCLALNLTNIFLSSMRILELWLEKGYVSEESQQESWPLFVDCSLSTDHTLRQLAEQSMDTCRRRLPRMATTLMYLRLLDYQVRYDSDIPEKDWPPRAPDATAWLNLLGDIAHDSHEESQQTNRFFRRKARELADALESDDPNNLAIDMLRGDDSAHSAGWRLAEALTSLMGTDQTTTRLQFFFNSCLMADEPNGIARRRRIRLRNVTAGQKTSEVASSFVLSNTALEFLVHRHLRAHGKGHKAVSLSFPGFLRCNRSASENRHHAAACTSISQAGRRDGAASPRRAAS